MADSRKPGTTKSANSETSHLVDELDRKFHLLQAKIGKARDTYLIKHKQEFNAARARVVSIQSKLLKARRKAAKAAVEAKKSGTKAAKNQLKKARAASLLLSDSLKEAKGIMVTAQSRLHAAKPFDRKLAARAKVLAKFEKDWDKKVKAETAARAQRAKAAAAKRRATAKKRAARRQSTK